jgi:hypothetical protein
MLLTQSRSLDFQSRFIEFPGDSEFLGRSHFADDFTLDSFASATWVLVVMGISRNP